MRAVKFIWRIGSVSLIQCDNIGLRFKDRILFKGVNIKFENDNCYGVIGANGAGKSTFLKKIIMSKVLVCLNV